jgi:hypothetical protein
MALRPLGSGVQYAFDDTTGLLHVVLASPGGVSDLGVLNGLGLLELTRDSAATPASTSSPLTVGPGEPTYELIADS